MKRRLFSKEFKKDVVLQADQRSVAEVCRENDILPTLINRWKREYCSNPSGAFSGKGQLWKDDAKIARYERLIGQLYDQVELLKKALEKFQQLRGEEKKGFTK